MKEYKSYARRLKIVTEPGDPLFKKAKIKSSKDSYDYIKQFWHEDITIYESFFILLLNRANNVTAWVKISQGGTAGTVADPKIICKYAIDVLAESVILAHNHPSGNLQASVHDTNLTVKISNALKSLDIHLLDHLILSESRYLSFADEGLL